MALSRVQLSLKPIKLTSNSIAKYNILGMATTWEYDAIVNFV